MIDKDKREFLAEAVPEAVIFDNEAYDDSIIGYTDDDRIVYSYDRMVEEYMIDNDCNEEEAMEWIDYNTIRSIPYTAREGNPPVIMYSIPEWTFETEKSEEKESRWKKLNLKKLTQKLLKRIKTWHQ